MSESHEPDVQWHPYLPVPADLVAPLGELAVAAGQVEMLAVRVYRAFLYRLTPAMVTRFVGRRPFTSQLDDLHEMMGERFIAATDPDLPTQWQAWSEQARSFMVGRNTLLHATWANSADGPVPFTAGRRGPKAHPQTSATEISQSAADGIALVRSGDTFPKRVRRAVMSEHYEKAALSAGWSDTPGWRPV